MLRWRLTLCLLWVALLAWGCRQSHVQPTATATPAPSSPSAGVSEPSKQSQPVATKAATWPPSPVAVSDGLPQPDIVALRWVMLEAINADRSTQGLPPVAWDETAARAGQAHAEEMASAGYFSHWDLSGHGPDYRYAQAGGQDAVLENIYTYWYRYDNGQPAPIEDWEGVIRAAQASLMQSPGHRQNILDPAHTHVGVGIAYHAVTGDVRITQEFINRYVVLRPLPASVALGTDIVLQGELLPGASEPLINLAYEPFPQPLSLETLGTTGTFISPAEIYEAIHPEADEQRFEATFPLNYEGRAGLYHVRVWVQVVGQRVPAVDAIVAVTTH